MIRVRFFAEGVPAVQGSHKAFVVAGKARITDDDPKTRPWRTDLAWSFRRAAPGWRSTVLPVAVSAVFLFRRPKSHLTAKGELRPGAPRRPSAKGHDLDKLQRAVGDALSKIAWEDDSQIVRWDPETAYTRDLAGAAFEIRVLESDYDCRLSPLSCALVAGLGVGRLEARTADVLETLPLPF